VPDHYDHHHDARLDHDNDAVAANETPRSGAEAGSGDVSPGGEAGTSGLSALLSFRRTELATYCRNAPLGDAQLGPEPGAGALAHASQQLEQPVLAVPPTVPLAAVQWSASFFVLHFVTVFFVMQHVTKPGLPQTECAAHLTTWPLHCFGRLFGSVEGRLARVLATVFTHFTY
jgi:hypothetical protein